MRKNLIVLAFMLVFLAFEPRALKAQTDAFFSNSMDLRGDDKSAALQGFGFASVDTQQIGFGFEKIEGGDDVPLANGLLTMSVTGLFYLLTKRKKENK